MEAGLGSRVLVLACLRLCHLELMPNASPLPCSPLLPSVSPLPCSDPTRCSKEECPLTTTVQGQAETDLHRASRNGPAKLTTKPTSTCQNTRARKLPCDLDVQDLHSLPAPTNDRDHEQRQRRTKLACEVAHRGGSTRTRSGRRMAPQEAGVWSLHKAAGDRRTKRTSRRWCFATRRAWARQLRHRSRLCWLLFRLRLRLLFRLRMRLLFHSRLRLLTTLRSLLVFLALQWDSTCGIEGARDPRERIIPPLLTLHARTTRLENVGCVSSLTCQLEHKCLRSSALRIHPTPWWSSGMRPIGKGRGNTV